jgi:hydroxymethylpyrimidine pyrophosphatase-like HAD family hydrolase
LEDILENLFKLNLNYQFISVYDSEHASPLEYAYNDFKDQLHKLSKQKIYKVLLRTDNAESALQRIKAVNSLNLNGYIAVRSWDKSLEILKRENAKGAAIKKIAEALNSKLIVAVGDYENDIDMLEAADIGYAVENACDSLKKVADRFTTHAKFGALADVIYDIEKGILPI